MPGPSWTDAESQALRELAEIGYSLNEIYNSGVFKRSIHAISSRAHAMRISLGGSPQEIDKDAFKSMMEARRGSDRV